MSIELKNLLEYSCQFKIWNLNYKLYSNSPMVIRHYKRAYSLFNVCPKMEGFPVRNISFQIPVSHNKYIRNIINDVHAKIYNTWMENFTDRILFLHASAVELGENYLLFIGESKSGKSTMAAMLRDYGAIVYNDDFTPIERNTGRVLTFPLFSNLRKGELSNLQKKYRDFFSSCFKRFGMVSRNYLGEMTQEEFRPYYSYNRELYSLNSHVSRDIKKKRLKAIFLKKADGYVTERLRKTSFPESFSMFIDAIHMPLDVFNKSLKSIISIFGDFDFYTMESSSAKRAIKLLLSNFT